MKRRSHAHAKLINRAKNEEFFIPEFLLVELSNEDKDNLRKVGFLLDALTRGVVKPERESHKKMLEVIQNKRPPKSSIEIAWMKYLKAMESAFHPTGSGRRRQAEKHSRDIDLGDNWDPSAIG